MNEQDEFKKEVFEYLNKLRESGITNMFGAAPFVKREFDLDIKEARELLFEWMDQF